MVAAGHGRLVKLSPSGRVYGIGAILLVALTTCSRKLSSMGGTSFIIPLAVAGIAYLLAIRGFFSTPRFMLLEYGCVAMAAAIILLRRITRPAAPQCSTD